jgi:ribosomal protein L24E
MPKCVYCQKQYEFPKGLTLVGKDGSINYLCSSKCRKNMAMGRRKVRWLPKEIRFNPKNKKKDKKKKK